MANSMQKMAIRVFFSVILCFGIAKGQPIINPEDVESLLPETPKTKNETVAAIVSDAVIQEAVQNVVGGGTLSGLVVKKNTVILPADAPDKILGQKEQIFTAPLSELEDIRKNITETAAEISENEKSEISEVEEIALAEIVPLNADKVTPDSTDTVVTPEILISGTVPENPSEILIAQALIIDDKASSTKLPQVLHDQSVTTEKLVLPGIVQSGIKLPEGIYPDSISLPAVIRDEISKPIIAVLHSKIENHDHGFFVLPTSSSSSSSLTTADGNNKTFEYGARIPVSVITTSDENELRPAVKIEMKRTPEERNVENIVAAVFTVAEDDNLYDNNDENDMVAAEDIIFRPLFRYRQQENERRRILENRSYQRPAVAAGYRRYRPSSNSYPSSNYNNDDYNYLRKNSYRKQERPRYYYNDYS